MPKKLEEVVKWTAITLVVTFNLYSNVLYKYTIKIKRMWSDG